MKKGLEYGDLSRRVRDNVLTNRKRGEINHKLVYFQGGDSTQSDSTVVPYEYKNSRRVPEIETPKLVSIGPFHHKQPHLQSIKLKIRNNCSASAQTLAEAMRQLEERTRNFYSEIFNEIDSGAFVDMMILDGCFLIELLRLYETTPKGTINRYFPAPFSLPKLQCELLMLENQLPLFVLEKLFDLTSQGNEPSLAQLALKFFDPLLHRGENFVTKLEVGGQHHHLLDLFHSSFRPLSLKKPPHSVLTVTPDERRQSRHSAKKLTDAGIALAKSENPNLLDIEINRGVLKIPTLHFCPHTHLVLLNLMDYESSNLLLSKKYFTDYVSFFSSLLRSEIDFDVLDSCGIVEGSCPEGVPRLFSTFCNEIYYDFDKSYLRDLSIKLNKYYNQKWHGWKAQCVRDYCSTPWKFFKLVGGILLIVQTIFTVLAYFRPPS